MILEIVLAGLLGLNPSVKAEGIKLRCIENEFVRRKVISLNDDNPRLTLEALLFGKDNPRYEFRFKGLKIAGSEIEKVRLIGRKLYYLEDCKNVCLSIIEEYGSKFKTYNRNLDGTFSFLLGPVTDEDEIEKIRQYEKLFWKYKALIDKYKCNWEAN